MELAPETPIQLARFPNTPKLAKLPTPVASPEVDKTPPLPSATPLPTMGTPADVNPGRPIKLFPITLVLAPKLLLAILAGVLLKLVPFNNDPLNADEPKPLPGRVTPGIGIPALVGI